MAGKGNILIRTTGRACMIAACILLAPAAQATTYKCTELDGKISYTNMTCAKDARIEVVRNQVNLIAGNPSRSSGLDKLKGKAEVSLGHIVPYVWLPLATMLTSIILGYVTYRLVFRRKKKPRAARAEAA